MVNNNGADSPGYTCPKSMVLGRTITAESGSLLRPRILREIVVLLRLVRLCIPGLLAFCVALAGRICAFGPIIVCMNLVTPISGSPTVARIRLAERDRSLAPISDNQDSISPDSK